MSDGENLFIAFLQGLSILVVVCFVAWALHSCAEENRATCREMMAVSHSLRDSLVIADASSIECLSMVKDSLVARAKRQP